MKYFIEHNQTRQWFHATWVPKFTNTFNGGRIRTGSSFVPVWTIDPTIADAYETIEHAQKWIKIFNLENVSVTEHEFML